MHIYAFGSVCRGEVDISSDIDMLAISDNHHTQFNTNDYSIYSYLRINQLWEEGNPFAWHLYQESRLVYTSNKIDFLKSIGKPNIYQNGYIDCKKFYDIFLYSKKSIEQSCFTEIFDLSSIFLAIRNFATCFSLATSNVPSFSRNSAYHLGANNISISNTAYKILERARILCTRGMGKMLTACEILEAKLILKDIDLWMLKILKIFKVKIL